MRLKTDDNLHEEVAVFLRSRGHDVLTVWDEGLRGKADEVVMEICRTEARGLITLDSDFLDIRAFPPSRHWGIIVLRLAKQERPYVLGWVSRAEQVLKDRFSRGDLWVVSERGFRLRRAD